MRIYNKLVRSKIPQAILDQHEIPVTRILQDDEYKRELYKKLNEEVNEFIIDDNAEELCDILEVYLAILEVKNVTFADINKLRMEKAEVKGTFVDKIFLERVIDKND